MTDQATMLANTPQMGDAARPHVLTTTGWVAGITAPETGQELFLGIPYAEPPVDGLRFKPPVARKAWQGTLDASRFGAAAPQIFDPCEGSYQEFSGASAEAEPKSWVGSEDCLTLNIWRRQNAAAKRPVLVWIHGGGNWLESSRLDIYHGDRFVAREDVLFISMNYRLGIFGFLDLVELGGEAYRGSHSNGLRDQRLALTWIKANVAAFGGDPDNITVMGESAGSIDISWHLTGGHLDGIARRVIMMSGVAGVPGLAADFAEGFTEQHGLDRSRQFLEVLGIGSFAALQSLSTEEIMTRIVDLAWSSEILFYMDSLFWPKAGQDASGRHPFAAVREGTQRGIDVMIGCTGYEMGLWLNWDSELDHHGMAWASEKLRSIPTDLRADCIALYQRAFPSEPDGRQAMHLLGDSIFLMPTIWFAEELTKQGENVWLYQFDKRSDERRGALHAADQAYLFGKADTYAGRQLVPEAAGAEELATQQALTAAMQDAVLAFMRAGDPNAHQNRDLPHWPRFDLESRHQLSFNTPCRIHEDPARDRRNWWTKVVYEKAVR